MYKLLFLVCACLCVTAPDTAAAGDTRQILQRYVDDYRGDPMLQDATFGIRIGDSERWYVVATRGTGDAPPSVTLHEGDPDAPTWYFQLEDAELLSKFDRGELAAGTSMAKAFTSDYAPMDVDAMDGFQPDESFMSVLMGTIFHFWSRGIPEVTRFNADVTRFTHGTDLVVLHYQPGLRSAWFSIKPGQHVNADERSRTNPFPSLVIVTRGKGMAKIGGKDTEIAEGQSIFIPPEVSHEFTNPSETPVEGILLMFGEGA